jgi:hypothetical protein
VVVDVPICAKFAHPAPEQRSTLYPATPTLSVDAVQARLICEEEAAVATKLAGAVGGVVSAGGKEDEPPMPPHPASSNAQLAKTPAKQESSRALRFAIPLFIGPRSFSAAIEN